MAFRLLGYEKMAERQNVKLVNLSRAPCTIRGFPSNVFLKKLRIPTIIRDADFLISVPKIKTHANCSFTGVLKNQFGCNPYPRKSVYHKRLNDAIVDLNAAFRPNLVVVDGIVAMEGYRGPTDGVPIRMNLLICGKDPVAVDYAIANIMGIDPATVPYLLEARRRGIGKSEFEITGIGLNEVSRRFRTTRPRWRNLLGLLQQDQ
jgi:uncharacterized protein (DUF362 family)